MIPQKNDLVNWANELLDALIPFFDDNSDLFHNYVDQKNTFSDGSGSMLIAGKFHSLASKPFPIRVQENLKPDVFFSRFILS